jgi:diacylglycerol kinase (ATP)
MISWLRKMALSFACAFSGVFWFIREERNARLHLIAALGVVAAGFFFQITAAEWCAVVLCIGAVIAAEMLNTAVEKLCDRVTMEREEGIRRVKDVSAGAVLVIALAAAMVGAVVFGPRVWALMMR